MLTPRSNPSRLTSMNCVAEPWNQVAVIQPSACHTVAKRSQSPASRQTTQFSTHSRIARESDSDNLIPERADAFDLGLDHVAVLEPLLRCAAEADAFRC